MLAPKAFWPATAAFQRASQRGSPAVSPRQARGDATPRWSI